MGYIVELYTDGACSGNPGPGGYGAIMIARDSEGDLVAATSTSGYVHLTTNNRMELSAVIAWLSLLKQSGSLTIYSDSKYLTDAFNEGRIEKWVANGYVKGDGQSLANSGLWERLWVLSRENSLTFKHVNAHTGNKFNELADKIAKNAIKLMSNVLI